MSIQQEDTLAPMDWKDDALVKANARILELEAAIRAILAINEQDILCDLGPGDGDQSMELSKALDTAECLVGWKK